MAAFLISPGSISVAVVRLFCRLRGLGGLLRRFGRLFCRLGGLYGIGRVFSGIFGRVFRGYRRIGIARVLRDDGTVVVVGTAGYGVVAGQAGGEYAGGSLAAIDGGGESREQR